MTTEKKKGGRPTKEESLRRRKATEARTDFSRKSLNSKTSKLDLPNKDPSFHYTFVKDISENGAKLEKYKHAGYSFVSPEENVTGSSAYDFGSLVRIPESDGGFLYLMKQPMKWYLQDKQEYHDSIDKTEEALFGYKSDPTSYGDINLNAKV